MTRVGILNLGGGNIASLVNVFDSLGTGVIVCEKENKFLPSELDLIVIPGVGSAGSAMSCIHNSYFNDFLTHFNESKKPVLGICLGAQLFFSHLDESDCLGLGWIEGSVSAIKNFPFYNTGWSYLDYSQLRAANLHRSLSRSPAVYFNHKYLLPSFNVGASSQTDQVGSIPAIAVRENIVGFQFHPEKSQAQGRIILRNLLRDYFGL